MEQLFTPWRFAYVTGKKGEGDCVFCALRDADRSRDAAHYVIHRAEHTLAVLNIYPYTTGHVLLVPHAHERRLSALCDAARNELVRLAARVEQALEEVYGAQGLNFGMNLGRCSGAGIEEHLHLHAVPRWLGDTSFMSVTGNTRVLPEELGETWSKLQGRL